MSDGADFEYARVFAEGPESECYTVHESLLYAPIPALAFRVLVDILHRLRRKEEIPSAPERAKLLGVERQAIAAAEKLLESEGYLMSYAPAGRTKLYQANSIPIPPGHEKRPQFVAAMHAYATEKTATPTLGKNTRVDGSGAYPGEKHQGSQGQTALPWGKTPGSGGETLGKIPTLGKNTRVDPGSPGSEVPPDPLLASYPPPLSQTKFLALSSTSSSAPVPTCAHEGLAPEPPAPSEPPPPEELRLLKGESAEQAALRFFNSEPVQNALFSFHGITPSREAVARYRNALESYAERGIRVTGVQFAAAVEQARLWWNSEPRGAMFPIRADPVLNELPALVMPTPRPSEKPHGPERYSDRGQNQTRRAGSRGRAPESNPELAAKIERWRQNGLRPIAAGGDAGGAAGAGPGAGDDLP